MNKKLTKILASVLAVMTMTVSVNAAVYNDIAYPFMDDVYRLDLGLSGGDDVTGDDANEIEASLCTLGIMQRDASGKFNPSAKLSRAAYEAAVRVIYTGGEAVDFAEYEAKYSGQTVKQEEIVAKLLGFIESAGIDANTIDVESYAAAAGITKGITYAPNRDMTRADFAKVVWNTLNSSYVHISYANGAFQLDSNDDKTLLQDKLGVYEVKGKLNAIPGLNLYGTISPKTGIVEINRVPYNVGAVEGVTDLFAYDVEGYAKFDKEEGRYTLLSLEASSKDETLTLDLKDVEDIDGTYFYYEEEDKTKKVKVDVFKYIMYNGDFVNELTDDMMDESGTITLTKSSKDVNYDIVVIKEYQNFFMTSFFTEDMVAFLGYGATFNGALSIDLDIETNLYAYYDGKPLADFGKLGKNKALSIIQNSSKSYTEIRVFSENVESSVSGETDTGWLVDGMDLSVDKNYIELSKNSLSGATPITLGSKGIFYYTEFGVIAGFASEGVAEYAVLKRAWFDDEKSETLAKVFTQDNEWAIAEFTPTVEIDAVKGIKNENVATELMAALANDETPYTLIRIMKNASGEIKFVDTILDTEAEKASGDTSRLIEILDFEGAMPWVGGWYVHGTPYHVPDATPMFMVPDDPDLEAEWSFVTAASIPRSTTTNPYAKYKAYTADSWNMASIAIRDGNTVAAENRDSYWYVYIRGVKDVYDAINDETKTVIDCYQLTRGSEKIAAVQYDLPDGWETKFKLTRADLEGTFTGIELIKGEVTGFMIGTYPHVKNNKIANADKIAGSTDPHGRFFWANSGGSLNYLAGKVIEVDATNKYIKVDVGGGEIMTAMFAVYAIAGTDADDKTHYAEGIPVEKINPGDMIYWYGSYYRAYCALVIHNYDWTE